MLERLGMTQFLAAHPTSPGGPRPRPVSPAVPARRAATGPSVTAPAAARQFVHATCWQWRLHAVDDPKDPLARQWGEELVDRAMLVASELVTNAVVHTKGPAAAAAGAGGRLSAWPWWTSRRVCWGWPPTLATPTPKAAGGLLVADQLASSWGCTIRRGRQGDLVRAAALICS